jgi:serine/threonine protein kinase
MKHICTRCNRISVDGNLWCQEKSCPAENTPEIFENGEWLGNIEIVKLVAVLRSSAVYEARRDNNMILLKVSHEGFQEKLKREAKTLLDLSKIRQHPMLPRLLPAYAQASLADFPYGKVAFGAKQKYYLVFEYQEGELLRDILNRTPQPWYQDVGWLVISLADVVLSLNQAGRLHLCLSPEMVLVNFDSQHVPRPMLLDLGLADGVQDLRNTWDRRFVPPAYTAPELIELKGKIGPATEVYGLGLLLYEMLAGHPVHEFRSQRDEDVYNAVLNHLPANPGRADLKNIPEIALAAAQKDYERRYKSVVDFARDLQRNFRPVPKVKKQVKVNWRFMLIGVAVLLAISLLVVLATLL